MSTVASNGERYRTWAWMTGLVVVLVVLVASFLAHGDWRQGTSPDAFSLQKR